MESSTNNTTRQLAIGETWSGVSEFRDNTVTIAVNLITTKNCVVFVQQSTDNINFVFDDQYAHEISIVGNESRFQVPAKARFYRVKVENVSGEVIPQIIVTTYFLDVNKDATLEQPAIIAGDVIVLNAIQAKDYEFNTLRDVSCDNTGRLNVIASLSPVDNQDVTITARSGTGFLSYITDNVAVATMPAITGTVAVSSMPHLSYLTDNVAVATQPALVFATDKVDATGSAVSVSNFPATQPISGSVSVSNFPATQPISGSVSVSNLPATQPVSGTVAVSSQPALSYLTDNVAVATLPPITGTVAVSSMPYLSYLTSNIAVATQPALSFSTDKVDATGSSVSVTGSVAVTNADITSIKTNTARFGLAIGSNYAEGIINTFTNLSITGGYLYNLSVYSDGSSGTNFLKVYGVAGATFADTPLLIVPVTHATSVNLSLSGLKALTGISVRATANYTVADNNAPTNGINCNLIFSPLV